MARGLLKKLVFRLDGAADSARKQFASEGGTTWEAEISLHSGTLPQSPRLMVLFRVPADPAVPRRYTLLPSHMSKLPEAAAAQLSERELRELLASSVKV
ncbi:MAG: hypothetical protein ACE5HQ_09165 [Gemmatimonadota bacterium]